MKRLQSYIINVAFLGRQPDASTLPASLGATGPALPKSLVHAMTLAPQDATPVLQLLNLVSDEEVRKDEACQGIHHQIKNGFFELICSMFVMMMIRNS